MDAFTTAGGDSLLPVFRCVDGSRLANITRTGYARKATAAWSVVGGDSLLCTFRCENVCRVSTATVAMDGLRNTIEGATIAGGDRWLCGFPLDEGDNRISTGANTIDGATTVGPRKRDEGLSRATFAYDDAFTDTRYETEGGGNVIDGATSSGRR